MVVIWYCYFFLKLSTADISHNVKFPSGCIERFSAGDLRARCMLREETEEFRKAGFVDIAESALSIGANPLWMLLT
jgi:hypothetical protein